MEDTRGSGKTDVLKDVDLKIYPGEFVGNIRRNGSGKSTLLKVWQEYISLLVVRLL